MIKLGDLDFTSIKQGSTDIIAVYLADEMIWGGSQPSSDFNVRLTLSDSSTSSVTFSSGTIPNATFAQRQDIVEVEVGDGITTIGNGAFADCSGLTSVTVASSVTTLGDVVFSGDILLSRVTFYPTTPPTRGDGIFWDLPQDYVCYVPSGSVEAYKTAWSGSASHIQAME